MTLSSKFLVIFHLTLIFFVLNNESYTQISRKTQTWSSWHQPSTHQAHISNWEIPSRLIQHWRHPTSPAHHNASVLDVLHWHNHHTYIHCRPTGLHPGEGRSVDLKWFNKTFLGLLQDGQNKLLFFPLWYLLFWWMSIHTLQVCNLVKFEEAIIPNCLNLNIPFKLRRPKCGTYGRFIQIMF